MYDTEQGTGCSRFAWNRTQQVLEERWASWLQAGKIVSCCVY